jgi:hypothetical protein
MTFIGLSAASICGGQYNFLHNAISFLAADITEHAGEAGNEVIHPGGFTLGLGLFYGFVVENLPVMVSGLNAFWRGHVMMFLRWEGNLRR